MSNYTTYWFEADTEFTIEQSYGSDFAVYPDVGLP